MTLTVKICGLSEEKTLEAAVAGGADMVGFVFHPASPRNIGVAVASGLRDKVGRRAEVVALTVNAGDGDLDEIVARVRPDWLQLHGSESADRIRELKARYALRIMKAIPVRGRNDLDAVEPYRGVADLVLFDAKPPIGAILPGGNGVPFNWRLLRGVEVGMPFMVSGGLDPANVAEAIATTAPFGVDVSSGVETSPGRKDVDLIGAFIATARMASFQNSTRGAA
ncbi:MAG: phosphoribosylanthranilate isomerase [Bauldia sp.]